MVDVEQRREGGWTVVRPVGDLDRFSSVAFQQEFADLAGTAVVVDLAEVPFVDSAGLGALVAGVRTVRGAGGDVAVVGARPALRRLFDMTGLDRFVRVLSTIDEVAAPAGLEGPA